MHSPVASASTFFLATLLLAGCDSSDDPTPVITEEDVSVVVRSDLMSLAAAVEVYNYSESLFDETTVRMTFREIEAGGEYERELDFGAIEPGSAGGSFVSSTQQVQPPLCYEYELQVRPEGTDERFTFQGGICE